MTKSLSVPYCTVKGFRASLAILRREPLASVDRQALVDRGLSPHAVYPVLGALRFLGMVDEDGRLCPAAAAFLDEGDIAGRRAVVENVFADLLADVTFPVEDREDVDRLLVERHDVAPGVAAFCSTFFLWLAAEAGYPVAELNRSRRGRPPAHLSQLSDSARTLLERNSRPRTDGLDDIGPVDAPAEQAAPAAPQAPAARPLRTLGSA
jgi:hypothetical protein